MKPPRGRRSDRRPDVLKHPAQASHLLGVAEGLIADARANGADLHPSARYFLQQAEILLASARIEMGRGDARLVATFAHLASEEAGRAIAVCTSPCHTWPGSGRGKEA